MNSINSVFFGGVSVAFTYLLFLIGFLSQFYFYIKSKVTKKEMNKWLALFYLIANTILALPICFTILIMGVMGTDSGTGGAIIGSIVFLIVGIGIYISALVLSILATIKSFKSDKKNNQ